MVHLQKTQVKNIKFRIFEKKTLVKFLSSNTMKKLTLLFTIIFVAGSLFAQITRSFVRVRQQKKDCIALVIGNSAYPDMPLTNPKNDAQDIAQTFEDMGFIVIKVLDADKEQMAMAIDDFAKKIQNVNAAVFYYSGHGMQVNGQNYLIPIGRTPSTQITEAKHVHYRAINAGEVMTEMENAKVNFSLIVLDACRNNPIGGTRGKLKGLASIDAPAGSLVMYSTKAGDVALDGEGRNSPFTTAFLEAIKTPGLDVNLLPSRITQKVRQLTGNRQTPGSYVQITQSFTFVPAYTDQELAQLKNSLSELEYKKAKQQQEQNKEDAELARKKAEIEALEKQIADMKNETGGETDLDKMLEIMKKKEKQKAELEEIKRQAEIERIKREQELAAMNQKKYDENIAKYDKIAASEAMQDMKPAAWNSVLTNLGLPKNSIPVGNKAALCKKLGIAFFGDYTVPVTGLNIKMRGIQGGTFQMGCNRRYAKSDETPHTVTVGNFDMMKYEVTFAEYDKFCDATGRSKPHDGGWGRGNRPVIYVSWNDAVAYAEWLSRQTGQTWRLPTEAEWEYAAKGGVETLHATSQLYAGSNNIDEVAWYRDNSGNKTQPVGQKSPNELGIYDMSGNVWEWCSDWYGSYSSSPTNNPQGASSGTFRVLRGGSWSGYADNCRSANRSNGTPTVRYVNIGFRLCRDK